MAALFLRNGLKHFHSTNQLVVVCLEENRCNGEKNCKQVLSTCGCGVVKKMLCAGCAVEKHVAIEHAIPLSGQLSYIRINTVLTSFEINLGSKASAQRKQSSLK